MTAWMVGLPLGLAVALVPFFYSLRRDRAAPGCACSLFLALLAPVLWLLGPMSSVLPPAWVACESAVRVPLILASTPSSCSRPRPHWSS